MLVPRLKMEDGVSINQNLATGIIYHERHSGNTKREKGRDRRNFLNIDYTSMVKPVNVIQIFPLTSKAAL